MRKLNEECGVFGVYAQEKSNLAALCYWGLLALQHRGQESAGMVLNDQGVFTVCREPGLVGEVFSMEKLTALGQGNLAVGHVRYATTGADIKRNVQPLLINHHKGRMALCHNGNLVNAFELRTDLEEQGSIFHTTADSEVIAHLIVRERLHCGSIEEAVCRTMGRLVGAYSLVIASSRKLLAVRDPHGFRPLCMGKRPDGSLVFASETCALDAVGADFVRDIQPGEVVVVDKAGVRSDTRHCGEAEKALCAFEYIYFARPDSLLDGVSVSLARQQAGALLAKEHPVDADVVVGVPDSGLDAAIGYARESGIPYAMGFTKNKYIARTFIAPQQSLREAGVNAKLNPIRPVVEGKRVVLIDDSIVRGTTCTRIIGQLRRAGAREIHMRVSAPPFVAPCWYGTDIDDPKALAANLLTLEELTKKIGADSLGYLSLDATRRFTPDGKLCLACFGGKCPTQAPRHGEKARFEGKING